jgi:flavin-dependent dehydrogenase
MGGTPGQQEGLIPQVRRPCGRELEPLLRALGAWTEFTAKPHRPYRTVRSAWGTPELAERTSITHPFGDGFHVERARFDELLARISEKAGASLHLDAGPCRVQECERGFHVKPSRGEAVLARFLVDASGRGATATASLPGRSRWLSCDRMVAVVGWLTSSSPEADLLIEASEDGWWYSAPQPNGQLVVALMTDADLTPAGSRNQLTARWHAALRRTEHTAERSRGASLASPIRIVRADSGRLLSDRRPGFCAVGDAATALDPLAGNGVARALRSGLEAAEAIDQALSGSSLVESGIAERFADDLNRRARYYLLERRWPAAPFWVRRHPPDWETVPLTLSPTSLLRWDGRLPTRNVLAVAEALLPRGAIAATLHQLRTAQPAHVALSALRNHAPLGDRRLLVGLQLLVEHGSLEVRLEQQGIASRI